MDTGRADTSPQAQRRKPQHQRKAAAQRKRAQEDKRGEHLNSETKQKTCPKNRVGRRAAEEKHVRHGGGLVMQKETPASCSLGGCGCSSSALGGGAAAIVSLPLLPRRLPRIRDSSLRWHRQWQKAGEQAPRNSRIGKNQILRRTPKESFL